MRLTELAPRWIHLNIFVFECPCCRKVLLSCKNVQMTFQEQWDILAKEGERTKWVIVPTKTDYAWNITGTRPSDPAAAFPDDLTVTPSLDCSASGHWHGTITKGEIH